jgi:tetratricopeptide (TPR) repeat protein
VLVFVLARALTRERATAILAALIFGFHPALIESVAWVSGVPDPLLTCFLLPAVLFFLGWAKRRTVSSLAFSLLFYILALCTKEPAVMLLAIVAVYQWLVGSGTSLWDADRTTAFTQRLRLCAQCLAPYLVVTFVYLIVHSIVIGSRVIAISGTTLSTNLLTIPALLLFYARLLVWPAPISPEYPIREIPVFTFSGVVLPVLILLVIAALFFLIVRRQAEAGTRNLLLFLGAWTVLPLVPVLYLEPLAKNDFAHCRYLYLSCVAFGMIVAIFLRRIPAGAQRLYGLSTRRAIAGATILLALALANAFQQVPWASNLLLFSRGYSVAPHNVVALTSLGIELGIHKQYPRAIALLQEAIQLDPNDWHPNFVLGYTYFLLGRTAEAKPLIEKSIQLRGEETDPDQYSYLAQTELRLGNYTKAEWAVRNAIRSKPDVPRYHHALGLILEQENRASEAAAEFRETLKYDPGNEDARTRLTKLDTHP